MSMAQITAAAASLNAAAAAYHGKIADIDTRVASAEAEVEQFLLTSRKKMATPQRLAFDPAVIHSKTSLALGVDPGNATRTIWHPMADVVAPSYLYYVSAETHFAALIIGRMYVSFPGYYEAPQYGVDKSVTEMDFVVAPLGSENLINGFLLANNILPAVAADWSYGADSRVVPILDIPNSDPAKRLFMRFRNRAVIEELLVPDYTQPQPINAFGGNSSFSLHELNVHLK